MKKWEILWTNFTFITNFISLTLYKSSTYKFWVFQPFPFLPSHDNLNFFTFLRHETLIVQINYYIWELIDSELILKHKVNFHNKSLKCVWFRLSVFDSLTNFLHFLTQNVYKSPFHEVRLSGSRLLSHRTNYLSFVVPTSPSVSQDVQ